MDVGEELSLPLLRVYSGVLGNNFDFLHSLIGRARIVSFTRVPSSPMFKAWVSESRVVLFHGKFHKGGPQYRFPSSRTLIMGTQPTP